MQVILSDAEQFIEYARSLKDFNADLPTFIAGLSLGGGMTAHLSVRAQRMKGLKFAGSVWCAPCLLIFDPKAINLSPLMWRIFTLVSRVFPKVRFN
jgi:alpha-beta hydrolase superfamily lysophospholipase